MEYTTAQKRAIKTLNQNLQIIACAGSGKTQVISQRIVEFLKGTGGHKASPGDIVAFTFTEKAAGELKERIRRTALNDGLADTGFADMFVGHHTCLLPSHPSAVCCGTENTACNTSSTGPTGAGPTNSWPSSTTTENANPPCLIASSGSYLLAIYNCSTRNLLKNKMTIYEVLTHTAGIPNLTSFPDYRETEWKESRS